MHPSSPHQISREPMPAPRATAHGELIAGRRPQTRVDPSSLPRLNPGEIDPYRHPFVFVAHPNKWEFLVTKRAPQGEWLPQLNPFALMPGANRVGEGGDMGLAALWLSQNRFVQVARALGPDGDYVREFDVVAGPTGKIRRVYYSVWDHLQVSDGIASRIFNMVGYRQWLRQLVTNGHIRRPSLAVIGRLVKVKGERIARKLKLPSTAPGIAAEIERERAVLALMKASFAEQFGYDPTDIEASHEAIFEALGGEGIVPDQSDEEPVAPVPLAAPPTPRGGKS